MKAHLPLVLPSAVGTVLIILTTLVQGILTERWGPSSSEQLNAFATALQKVPTRIGDWEVQEITEMDPREREAAGAVGDLSRTYRNPHTQEVVSVYLICGPSRAVAVHTPEACYVSSGFRIEDKIQPYDIPFANTKGEFRTATFLKEDPTGSQLLRVFWAWNATGQWEAPEWPRMKYGGRTPLNKVYFIARSVPGEPVAESPALAFAKEFLPVVTALLFPEQAPLMSAKPSAPASSEPTPQK
ncbi:MAG: EpsI family protein [Thermoguttaceae bacterium]|nr:EpsI family protein [Thermoguttaceae bacterium]MDW8038872.1 exosortase-associated EpsI family protein [Thermoguttaceae bacterium]